MSTMIGNDILLSLEQVISSAKSKLRIDNTTEHDDDLEYWGNEALLHIGDKASFLTKTQKFDIIDGAICLPRGFVMVYGIGYASDDDHENINKYTWNRYFVGNDAKCDDFYIQNGYLVFNRPERLVNTHHCYLLFETKNLDCNGVYFVTEFQERAVRDYMCWQFAQKFYDRIPRDMRMEYMKGWQAQAAHCRSVTAQTNFEQNREKIAYITNIWVNQRYTWWAYYNANWASGTGLSGVSVGY